MNYEPAFPKNQPFYEVKRIETFKELIDNSESLYSDRPAYKLKNSDGVYYDITYKKFRHDIYYLGALFPTGTNGKRWRLSALILTNGL